MPSTTERPKGSVPIGSEASGYSPEEEDVDDVRDGVEDDEWSGEPSSEDVEETGGEGE